MISGSFFDQDIVSPLRHDILIRQEIYNAEQLEQFGEDLAITHSISSIKIRPLYLQRRLSQNASILARAYDEIRIAMDAKYDLPPAAEWLIDNYFVIEEQIRDIRNDLSPGFYLQLPKLSSGPLKGYPRVYALSLGYAAHTDSFFNPTLLGSFIEGYQRRQPLSIGELWAIAVTLRIVLIENLRRAATLIITDRKARLAADRLADQLLNDNLENKDAMDKMLARLDEELVHPAFAVQIIQRLRGQNSRVLPVLQRLEDALQRQNSSTQDIVRSEHQNQGALTVTMRNIITSMRAISSFDWVGFFEHASHVNRLLHSQSSFGDMDLSTRNLYRRAIERMAQRSSSSEFEVTQLVLRFATEASIENKRERDPGYYLIDEGRALLRQALGYKPSWRDKLFDASSTVSFTAYIVTNILLVTCLIEFGLAGTGMGKQPILLLLAMTVATFFPAWEAAATLVNRLVMLLFPPTVLPALALASGITDDCRSFIVVPVLLSSIEDISPQIEQLSVHYLGNEDKNLDFALLSDWKDAPHERLPEDEILLSAARQQIDELNQLYPREDKRPRFFLFHRRRLWNPSQGSWMGWERKRGKLHEFNRLLRGATDTSFILDGNEALPPPGVRFVITLDADTRLPRGTIRRLIGKMAHPLNRPVIDTATSYVIKGYGILQPRVSSSLPTDETKSLFQKVFYRASGIDPYAFASSDIYQDLFAEGSFTGKGIYDVDAFEAVMKNRIPENAILSHDLIEGIFARAGLASDIEVVEEYPARYDVASSRQHRWARGDWQLLPWIFGNPSRGIPALGHWKMVDNLRRTLTPLFSFVALTLGWMFAWDAALSWTALIVLTLSAPLLLGLVEGMIPHRGTSKTNHLLHVAKDVTCTLQQVCLTLVFLPHQSWSMLDAMVRTWWRLGVSHRFMLEWVTAAETVMRKHNNIAAHYIYMSGGLGLTFLAFISLALIPTTQWFIAAPFLFVWLISPAIAEYSGRPIKSRHKQELTEAQQHGIRLVARATWRFFERFVNASENFLPPDNFQEDPDPVIAHRTSPTNIGLYLLTVIAAQKFSWIGPLDALARLANTLGTIGRMERFRGHLYNWYETTSLNPLLPRYISSVDSGNLAGFYITVAQYLRAFSKSSVISANWAAGVNDNVLLISRAADQILLMSDNLVLRRLSEKLTSLTAKLSAVGSQYSLMQIWHDVNEISANIGSIHDLIHAYQADGGISGGDLMQWGKELVDAISTHRNSLLRFCSWLPLIAAPNNYRLEAEAEALLTGPLVTIADISALCARVRILQGDKIAPPLDSALTKAAEAASEIEILSIELAEKALRFFHEMDFAFLLDPLRKLLSIGYRVEDQALDASFYDLLASEARLASMVAIAKGDISAQNWFRLGRTVTPIEGHPALVSWSGSMFEYLMPTLVMCEPSDSLIGVSNQMVVRRQIAYGKERGIPWGVSESAYNGRDFNFTYQYSSFGVPGLGLKRGLSDDIVIAPYATALASMIEPVAALANLDAITAIGGRGAYGYYEAIDFTKKRLPENNSSAVVHTYMAHHQAMSIVAFFNVLNHNAMQDLFHANPLIQATELLLQELPPRNVALAHPRSEEVKSVAHIRKIPPPNPRCFSSPHTLVPRTHLLSHSDYTVMVTTAGSGYSQWRNLAVTRWREDTTQDNWGSYIYLRDIQSGNLWSASYQPLCVESEKYNVAFFEDRAEFSRTDGDLSTVMNIVAAAEDDGEVRRISIHNYGDVPHDIELTSYAELVLTAQNNDVAHPAFAKMFVQTEFLPKSGALLASRRPRSPEEAPIYAVHLVSVGGEMLGNLQYETDRARFLGRGRDVCNPQAIDGRPLSDTTGTVLDPVFSLRCRVRVPVGQTIHISFWTLTASTREQAIDLAEKYRAPNSYHRAASRAWTQAQLQYQHLGLTPDDAHLFQRLANHVIYDDRRLHASALQLQTTGSQSALWSAGVSGDLPIILLRVDVASDLKTLRQLVRAHGYWTLKGLAVDLVILNEQPTSYLESLHNEIEQLVRNSESISYRDVPKGRIIILRGDQLSPLTQDVLLATARAVISGHRGSLMEHLSSGSRERILPPPTPRRSTSTSYRAMDPEPLDFFNGLGGFSADGREYVVMLEPGQSTPAPWINVIANPHFGFQVSADGAGYSWAMNSREFKLTPWSNDPVKDPAGEVIYLRDLDTGILWSPTAAPLRDRHATYVARHGFGYSSFSVMCNGIESVLTQYLPLDKSIKISRLKLSNTSSRSRRLSVTAYTEWVLGAMRPPAAPPLSAAVDPTSGAILVSNPWNNEFGTRTAFIHMRGGHASFTNDRSEFIGRNGSLRNPAALTRSTPLSGRLDFMRDAATACQNVIMLRPGEEIEIVFFLGEAATSDAAKNLIRESVTLDLDQTLQQVKSYWRDILGRIEVQTPDRAFDIMQNGWLMYQTIVCRIWARSGFYQSSGAYGYRDQLQDVMTLAAIEPEWTRRHLLRAAGRQFPEGDVQHWWLPSPNDAGRGVRTRFTDDPLWLVYAATHYMNVTGDVGVLNEQIAFLNGPVLTPEQHENFFMPEPSRDTVSFFDHCVLAVERSLTRGEHGLSLFGGGDWNDGMNRVGIKGQGESVWLSWFLLKVIADFLPYLEKRDPERVQKWQEHAENLRQALEENGWDGEWYRRGFYDNGAPLGSAMSDECKIDSIAQSWSVISGAADPERQRRAMKATEQYLVRNDEGVAQLFTPPFDTTAEDPGYIKGYPPGLRENGGQYTHAALWSVMAFALLDKTEKAFSLLSMLNPINHSTSRAAIYRYKVEPYVVAADVYTNPQHLGRGGWTWYTGSAGWMFRVGLETILGFDLRGDMLRINPHMPHAWPRSRITYRYKSSVYILDMDNTKGAGHGVERIELDGKNLEEFSKGIPLSDDGKEHKVVVYLG